MEKMKMMLCHCRHQLDEGFLSEMDGAIYPKEISRPMDFAYLDSISYPLIKGMSQSGQSLELYVTGLSTALVSVINACYTYKVPLALMQWDNAKHKYIRQLIKACPLPEHEKIDG